MTFKDYSLETIIYNCVMFVRHHKNENASHHVIDTRNILV